MHRLLSVLAFACWAVAAQSASAIEPSQLFLDGLRDRGYFDVAMDYLNAAENSPNVPVQFKDVLPYERGLTLVKSARHTLDPALRETQLNEGQQVLEQFVAAQPLHLLAISARSELGSVIVERGRMRVERAQNLTGAEKQALLTEARGLYTQSITSFASLAEELKVKLQSYPAALDPKRDARRVEERDRYRQDQLQAQLLVAAAREEMVDTLEPGSKEWTDAVNQAAAGYKDVYEKYRTRLAGLYARMYQGRCLYKVGKAKEASGIFNDLLANPDTDAFRTLKIKTMVLAVDSWSAQALDLEVINRAIPLIDSARQTEERSDDFMVIRLSTARSCKAYAAELAKKNPRDPQAKQLIGIGRKLVDYVADAPGPYQQRAREMLPDFTGGDPAVVAARPEPTSFTEASAAVRDSIAAMQAASLLVKTLPGKIAATKETAEQAELKQQLAAAQAQALQAQNDSMHYCRLALGFADRETNLEELNLNRYLLCYLLYTEGSYFDATVFGEFLARHYPNSQGARDCAKIAMNGYLKLYTQNETDDKQFETDKTISMCDYIVQRWPDQPEAEEALNTLIPFMIKEKKLQEAQDYLSKIPVESPHRGSAELKTGQALWASYLDNSQQIRQWEGGVVPLPEGVNLAARKAELEVLKTKAKQTLVDGVGRMQAGEMNTVLATAVLSLAQIHVDTNEAPKAVALLEDPKIGVLTLVAASDPAVSREGFAEEAYKTALRAYISSLATSTGDEATTMVDKAKGIMDLFQQQMGSSAQGRAKLTSIYVSLARDLQRQMEIAEPDVKKSLGQGFEAFLKPIAADASELDILNWVAETYRGMGESFGLNLRTMSKDSIDAAARYYTAAAETYQRILDLGKQDKKFLSPGMALHVRMQIAKTQRGMGKYVEAMNMFEEILKAQPTLVPIQIEAARTYQDWGGFKDSQKYYLTAITGGRPDKTTGRNAIWGWGQIARLTAPTAANAQYKDQFHEARYNLALCRYNYALSRPDAAEKKKEFQQAKRDISLMVGLYPDLGGEKWRPAYDDLLKNIQKALGEPTLGIAAIEAEEAADITAEEAPAASKTVPTSTPAAGAKSGAAPSKSPAKGAASPASPAGKSPSKSPPAKAKAAPAKK